MPRLLRPALFAAAILFSFLPTAEAASPGFERAIFLRVNMARAAHGLPRLHLARPLHRAAARHSSFLVQSGALRHDSADGSSFSRRIHRVMQLRMAGETLAFGQTALQIVKAWLASPGHRAILLEPAFRLVGVGARQGHVDGESVWFVTADLATA